jgi:polysaccharide pyruvyl transferase CsaB
MAGSARVTAQRATLRRPLLCGYYGEHNLGDDALLEALLLQLPADWTPLVTAHDQAEVQQRHGVATTERRGLAGVLRALERCDSLILGGGSLLQDATSFRSLLYYAALMIAARLRGKPVLIWGQGLGPLNRRRSRAIVRRVLPLATGISWRDPESAALSTRLGVVAVSGTDPVWSLPSRPWQGQGGPIVLCWRPTSWLQGERWRPLLEALAKLAELNGREVLWIPFHTGQDTGLLAELIDQGLVPPSLAARSREQIVTSVNEAMDLFQQAGLVVAMRLHGLILAALAGSPCAALSYDPKVAAAAEAMDCPCSDLAATLAGEELRKAWQQQLDQPLTAATLTSLKAGTRVHKDLLNRFSPLEQNLIQP